MVSLGLYSAILAHTEPHHAKQISRLPPPDKHLGLKGTKENNASLIICTVGAGLCGQKTFLVNQSRKCYKKTSKNHLNRDFLCPESH